MDCEQRPTGTRNRTVKNMKPEWMLLGLLWMAAAMGCGGLNDCCFTGTLEDSADSPPPEATQGDGPPLPEAPVVPGTSEVPGPPVADDPSGLPSISTVKLEAHFTDVSKTKRDMEILDHAVRLVNDTPPDAEIRIALHSLTLNDLVDALIKAKQRGVRIQVAHDGEEKTSSDNSPGKLHSALGSSHRWCSHGGTAYGCISDSKEGILHSKLMLFSQTLDSSKKLQKNVVWLGSANMTWNTGSDSFNNTLTYYDDVELYESMRDRYFKDLWEQKGFSRNDYFDEKTSRGLFLSAASKTEIMASPEQDGDILMRLLERIQPDAECRLRLGQSFIYESRRNVVDKVVELRQAGCQVFVVSNNVDSSVRSSFKKAKINLRKNDVHDKNILIYARFDGSPLPRKIVVTGSHNWSVSANKHNDELLVKVENAALYDQHVLHFNAAYSTGSSY